MLISFMERYESCLIPNLAYRFGHVRDEIVESFRGHIRQKVSPAYNRIRTLTELRWHPENIARLAACFDQ